MKVYILLEQVFPQCEEPYSEILGVFQNREDAEKERQKTIQDNIDNFDFVRDENENKNILNSEIIFFGYQENWDNYIEYQIIEKEVE